MDQDDSKKRPQDLFEEEAAFEEAPVGASVGEEEDSGEWPDQPVDDFTQTGEAYVEEVEEPQAAASEPVEDDFGANMEDPVDPATSSARASAEEYLPPGMSESKPSMMKYLPYLGVGAVLIVLGYLGYQQMSGMMAASQDTAMTPPPLQTADSTPPSAETPPAETPPPALPPSPPPIVAPTPPPPASASPPVGTTAKSAEYILDPNAQPAPAAQNEPAVPLPPPLAPGVGGPPPNVEGINQQLAALGEQIQEMKRNQERIDEQLRNMQNAPPPPTITDDSLKNNMRTLEEKLAALEQRTAAAPLPSAPAGSVDKPSASGKKSTHEAASPLPKPKKKKARKKVSRTADNQWQKPDSYMPPGGGWILRSATPGSAWISQGMSSDLQRVSPGDKVPGLGTIVSVRMVAGRWLVEGTQGSVR